MPNKFNDISNVNIDEQTEQMSYFATTFLSMGGWSWLILGMALVVAEIFIPSSFIIWFGLSAILAGVTTLILDIGWQLQFLIFGVSAVFFLLFVRRLMLTRKYDADQPNINQREEQLKGQVVVVVEPIINGVGKVKLGDTLWQAKGDDAEIGENVVITGISGASLHVTK